MHAIRRKHYAVRTGGLAPLLTLLFTAVLAGCGSTYPRVQTDAGIAELTRPRFEIPEPLPLEVRVQVFDPGKLPVAMDSLRGLSETIRSAESIYVATQLRNTLYQATQWGTIRVVSRAQEGDELLVGGRIVKSNGEELKLEAWAVDATGREWFHKTFSSAVSEGRCKQAAIEQSEAHQNVFNKIANELGHRRRFLTVNTIQEIRHVAEMRFAEELLPEQFGGFLQREEGGYFSDARIRLDYMPSDDYEFLARIRRVRSEDHKLVEMLDAHYVDLCKQMAPLYAKWRHARIMEMNCIRDLEAAGHSKAEWESDVLTASPDLPSVPNPLIAIAGKAEESRVELEEMALSFGYEFEPSTLLVEGSLVELDGSAEAQYLQWRELLENLYKVETEAELIPGSVTR